MFGLIGFFAYGRNAESVDPTELLRSLEPIQKRGPSGACMWVSPDQRLGLVHRRLSIIDPSSSSAQPMTKADGKYQIVFSGEIYNHRKPQTHQFAAGVAVAMRWYVSEQKAARAHRG